MSCGFWQTRHEIVMRNGSTAPRCPCLPIFPLTCHRWLCFFLPSFAFSRISCVRDRTVHSLFNLALWATCDEDLCMSFQAWWVCSAVWRYGSSPALHILRRTHWLISVVGSYEQFVDQIFVWVQVFSVWETKQAVGNPVSFWLHLHVYLYQRESLLLSPQCKSARFMASKPAYHQPASFSSLIQLHSSIGFTLPFFHYSSEFYMFSVSSCHFKWDGVVEWE